ncbi:hypothetical protein BCV72DRAFT_304945 [Rhizopus microsporus var. microsporus]|uniref:Uncharacterized protein n=2 Tax=Rhizopus microsporus TaxID=58291 RepID=A0A2G4SUI7_RHIZD|nr:uncharacterized protein RHIMIDRAFT_237375 [Rhizopus microsporus ATCC 52813]ORE07108.1 hypothetical protein BCV72DRAFT_304945 [Rhizopus microsporus var. microsporus]PHZ12447.1 hypothetical protein RHIMIDRAFT_237375 [Rhizopus microsporus ATCC 52813]
MYHFAGLRILYSWHLKPLIVLHSDRFVLSMLFIYPSIDSGIADLPWILTDIIEKHKDFVYDLNGAAVTGDQGVENFSNNVSVVEYYNVFISNHCHMGYDLATAKVCFGGRITTVTNFTEILLSRIPTTVKEYLTKNKHTFLQ